MGRKSKIESHPQSKVIVKRLASGEEYSKIVQDFSEITWYDLDYYAKNKLPELISKSPELKAELSGDQGTDTLAEVRSLKEKAIVILTAAQGTGDLKTALLGIREARGCLESILKAEGRIQEQNVNVNVGLQQVNIYQSPEWLVVGSVLAESLASHPEIRSEVASRLLALQEAHKA
jgi:hypothetical protein